MPSPNQITVKQLARLVGTPDSPVIIDLCIDEDFSVDPRLIPSAYRHPFTAVAELADSCRDKAVVLYCQKGKKISEGAAAILRTLGVRAEVLQGGQFAWRDAGLPLVPFAKIPSTSDQSLAVTDNCRRKTRSVWVTRQRPKIDRIACPWLIRRFIDPDAQFLFVAPATVLDVAEKFNATAFDVEGVFWSHRDECCTFDTMIEEFELNIDALHTLASVVRGADTNRSDLAPQCAGLLAMSVGLSRLYKDDLAQLDAGMMLYDSLYRWARDAMDEGHDWPAVKSPASNISGS